MVGVNKDLEANLLKLLTGSLIVSCQPVENGPMDSVEMVVAMAKAAEAGGAKGLRIEGAARVAAVAATTTLPIVGIVKRDLTDSPVRITPFLSDVTALAEAGASIIAFDGTPRPRPVSMDDILHEIHQRGCVAMADCADFETGLLLANKGCTFIGSTMSGYTDLANIPAEPDYALVESWAKQGLNVIAEGRYNTPQSAATAIQLGAKSVTVGSAITRIEHITQWFADSVKRACA